MYRFLTGVALVLVITLGCDERIHVLNVAPSITAVGPVDIEGDVVTVVYWVRDHEEDTVDIEFFMDPDCKNNPLTLFGGHGDVGLTTSRSDTGKAHPIQFKQGDLSIDSTLTLCILVIDDHGEESSPFQLEFSLDEGLPSP